MPFELQAIQVDLGTPFTPKPIVHGWNRIEGRVRAENFERALRAEARDALWFLARQWQFLELRADDAGSPIDARVALRETPLARFRAGGDPVEPFPQALPLETVVEREAPPSDRVAFIQVYRAFFKSLRTSLAPADCETVLAKMRDAFVFDPALLDGVKDAEAEQLATLSDAHLFDVAGFLAKSPADFRTTVDGFGLDSATTVAAKAAGDAVRDWYRELYEVPATGTRGAWVPERLDYAFACATEPGAQQIVLDGSGYANGRLDWFAVDVAAEGTQLGEPGGAPTPPTTTTVSMLPTAVSFAGMPSHRFWELENRKVEFGALTSGTTDIGKMLLTEFVLAYGNDWCIVPYVVKVGSLCETLGIVAKDVFGDVTHIRAADRGTDEDWRRWAMFGLETRTENDRAPARIFVPPTTPKMLESAPLERVVFLRDEMANMCWAVERIVPSAAGIGVDGEQFALSQVLEPPVEPAFAEGATARYRLGTSAPLNWRPFIPVREAGSVRSVRLQRGRLPLASKHAIGRIIGEPQPTYFINEEEIPRAGRIVVRTFQRTRWIDGRVALWLGRRTLTGRGEGSSGLEFDKLEEIPSRE